MAHTIKVSEAFQIVDSAPKKNKKIGHRSGNDQNHGSRNDKSSPSHGSVNHKTGSVNKNKLPTPDCPYGPCKDKGLKHLLKDCPNSSRTEKDQLYAALTAAKAKDGPSRSTRGQTAADKTSKNTNIGKEGTKYGGTAGRRTNKGKPVTVNANTPSCPIKVSDGRASHQATGRCDDGSDASILSPRLAERAALQSIVKMHAINPVRQNVALMSGEEPKSFSFSRSWKSPSTVLHLSSGQLALSNVTFVVADDDLACKDLIIGRSVLQHLQVDTRTLLEKNRAALDCVDCTDVGNPTISKGGAVSRMMIARLNRIREEEFKTPDDGKSDRPRVNFYAARSEEDPFPDSSLLDPLDEDQHEDIRSAVQALVQSAKDNGLPQDSATELDDLVNSCLDIVRVSFSAGPPAKIKPLTVDLTPEARPVKVRLRNYSREQREFLVDFVKKLVRNGMAYPNPTSAWACPPLLVPEAVLARFRFTVVLRAINKFTVKHQYPMPNLEHEVTKLNGSRYYATFDLSHGYWKFELDKDSQDKQSFITPDGNYTPTRIIHGTTNAVTHLQSSLADIISPDLRSCLLSWLDDILLHHSTVNGLLKVVQDLFDLCAERNIKLHPSKCCPCATQIRWCGRLVSAHGIRYDPKRLEGLLNMGPQTTEAHLQQFLCALQWVKNGIPQFSELVQPLHDLLEQVYDRAVKRTKRAVSRYQLTAFGWNSAQRDAFEACKTALADQVTLSHRDETQRLCVYTNGSDTVWSGIFTQVPREDLPKPHSEQRHQPLAFLSDRFNKTQLGWAIIEKEAYAVFASLERMHWLAATPDGFDLYTDHNNLIFLFDPLSVVPDLSRTTLRKVLRWAVRLNMYNYTCFHITGADNVWADLLGRWSVTPTIRRLVRIPELPFSSATGFEWPTLEEIYQTQTDSENQRPGNLEKGADVWRNKEGAIWVPDTASDLQLRLCIIAHTGPSGRRGASSTESILRAHYFWSTTASYVRSFLRACIHCLSTFGGGKVPRPFGPYVHGTALDDLLQFDYIELGPSTDGCKYVLMLRDDHSDYKWFLPSRTPQRKMRRTP